MFGTRKRKTLGLIVVGIATLGAVTYGTFSMATHNASASSGISTGAAGRSAEPLAKSDQTVPGGQEQELTATILQMLDEHMGLTGSDADKLAATMATHMQGATQDADVTEMVKSCLQQGTGMMNGTGMMGSPAATTNTTQPSAESGSTHESHHPSNGTA
jgi:hypothetical protein